MRFLAVHEKIAAGVRKNFHTRTAVTNEYIAFAIQNEIFTAEVVMCVIRPEPQRLAVETSFWLCDAEGCRLEFSHCERDDLLFIQDELSEYLRWSQFRSLCFSPTDVNLALYLCIDTSEEDIEEMKKCSLDSSLLRNVLRMSIEISQVYPPLFGVATKQIQDFDAIAHFVSTGCCAMN